MQIELLRNVRSKASLQRSTHVALERNGKDRNYLVCYESQHYSSLLRELDSATPILFVKGSFSVLEGRHFAIVRSRRASI